MWGMDEGAHAGSGSWIVSLLEHFRKQSDIKLAVACVYPGLKNDILEADGIIYFSVPQGRLRRIFRFADIDEKADPVFINKCSDIIKKWHPDIIHIHGTERFYGLVPLRTQVDVPCIISIQGLLNECCKWRYTFGDLPLRDIMLMHRPVRFIRGIGPLWDYRLMLKKARREREIIQGNNFFMGRTDWDRAHIHAINPSARYYHVGELLRQEFRMLEWDVHKCRRHSIIFTNARGPRANIDSLFKAVALLKKPFADVLLRIAGVDGLTGEYGQHLEKAAKKSDILNNVEFLGYLNADKMSHALVSSHVFVLSSLIENSPNSLCEAQTVGLPCVASYTGGVPSLISEGETGVMVPAGDSSMIADRIARIFENDTRAVEMGKLARHRALMRHDPDIVFKRLLAVYKEVINFHKTNLI